MTPQPPTTITDGFGNQWDATCPDCGGKMQVMRPGDARCEEECWLEENKNKMITNKFINGLLYLFIGIFVASSLLVIVANTWYYLDTGLWTGELKYQTRYHLASLVIIYLVTDKFKGVKF